MSRKSREKRECRQARMGSDYDFLLREIPELRGLMSGGVDREKLFCKHLEAMRALFLQYNRLDAAIALCVSELWPANTGSPIKHIFSWRVLLELEHDAHEGMPIASYTDFKAFSEALYEVWLEFPMLEDFSPEGDWGQIKVRLAHDFVPMFYGCCVERMPDFVEAFRITYAHVPEAQAFMDLAVALQARIIESLSELVVGTISEVQPANVEIAPQNFWQACRSELLQIGNDIKGWRYKAGEELDAHFGVFKAPLECGDFENSVMQGDALPFLAVEIDGTWVPMSVRSAPSLIIEHWAKKKLVGVSSQAHRKLAQFVAERFQNTVMGPLILLVGDTVCKDLTISCLTSDKSGVYLICACDHASIERLSNAAKNTYDKVRRGAPLCFRLADGRFLTLSRDGSGPSVDELHIIIVVTMAGTALSTINLPAKPTRLLPLADFISIFDSLSDVDELEHYWRFTDDHKRSISPFSHGAVDLFASFKDTYGVLVEGAISPTFIGLAPNWGTSWRFNTLKEFWSNAPDVFPDGSAGWRLSRSTEGVVKLQSRHHKALAYSTLVDSCTVQTVMEISEASRIEDVRLIDLFVQLLADCNYRCRKLMTDIPLYHQPHVIFSCFSDPSSLADAKEPLLPLDEFTHVITGLEADKDHPGKFHLQVDTRVVLAGLNAAKDGSFEVRCLLEALEKCHAACSLKLPNDLAQRLSFRAAEAARYHIRVVERYIDVPDYVDPIIPSPTYYKLARRQLSAEIMALGLVPGRYELSDAKTRIDPASARLRLHIENRLASLDRCRLLQVLIEQHDALLVSERVKIQRARQSLAHSVEYDRLDAVEDARKEYGTAARHYRYLLEKTVSSPATGDGDVTEDILRELVGLVDWYMVLTGASDTLHNGIDVGGVEIDDSYIPEVFYSEGADDRETAFAREYAKSRLGLDAKDEDSVEGESEDLLSSEELKKAFITDLGFDLKNMITVLIVLSQAQRHGFDDKLSLSYAALPNHIIQVIADSIEGLEVPEAEKIVDFLTLSETGILRLSGRDVDEMDIPYWERNKRVHRYTIRPLVTNGSVLRWGAETTSRAMNIWMSAVRDGHLPADFKWPHVEPVIRKIKESIETRLELRSEEIFRRYTPFVLRGIDFFRRFKSEGFEDVGDFDVFAYWPDENLLVTVECKYNQPPYTLKDTRRLRDRIFGKAENDKAGQFSRILRRRKFVENNSSKLLELLNWPLPKTLSIKKLDLYVSRDVYYWMVHPPYPVPTQFVRVDTLDSWIRNELSMYSSHE